MTELQQEPSAHAPCTRTMWGCELISTPPSIVGSHPAPPGSVVVRCPAALQERCKRSARPREKMAESSRHSGAFQGQPMVGDTIEFQVLGPTEARRRGQAVP